MKRILSLISALALSVTAFAYNITCSHVLSHILFRRSGLTLIEYLQPRLFDKLGIEDVVWEMDLDGKNMGNIGAAENFQLKFSGCREDPYAGLEFIIKGRQSNIALKGSREK